MEKLKNNYWIVSLVFIAIMLIMNTCQNSKMNSLQKKTDECNYKLNKLQDSLSKLPTKEVMKKELEQNMYKFLIFEEDVDKKKVSLSEIQMKLEK